MYDLESPIEIAKDIYWVGHVLPDDPFQCHVYLIKDGKESILIDPGSKLTWPHTRKKILQLMPLEDIRYIVCQHQDPDITSCISDIFEEIGTEGRSVVTHWRSVALLKHYDWKVDFYEIEEHQWILETGSRSLQFVFTPYMHFPGAFCSYDTATQVLFSSDIFGAFTETFQLYATDADAYFEQMRPFHSHYMPSTEIVNSGLDNICKYPLEMIAPQHGSILKKELIIPVVTRLRELDVGLFLDAGRGKDIRLLTRSNAILAAIFNDVAYSINGFLTLERVLSEVQKLFKIERIIAMGFIDHQVILFDSAQDHAIKTEVSEKIAKSRYPDLFEQQDVRVEKIENLCTIDLGKSYVSYTFVSHNGEGAAVGMMQFLFDDEQTFEPYELEILKNFQSPFNIMLSKTLEFYKLEEEKNRFFSNSITDSLTALYNRYYLNESGKKEFVNAKRYDYPLSVVMLDLDHFKLVNDTYGHDVGDIVLKDFARKIKSVIREGDMAYRYGGEEFVLVLPHSTAEEAQQLLLRIRERVIGDGGVKIGEEALQYRFSGGVQQLENESSLEEMLKHADQKLYISKHAGRDRITI
ncbi:MAG: diguanylate cyclase [Helicobacteraceae bacterium]|jgi:diguanylate cyclase (GGDEF)-like protein|nr:diguanylate cyclase [Helicobacteraceae bacterium]